MGFKVGDLVVATKGKDKGEIFLISNILEKSVELVNGRNRQLKTPKTKNLKHIKLQKSLELDFKNLKDCDIIYMIECFKSDLKINVEDN